MVICRFQYTEISRLYSLVLSCCKHVLFFFILKRKKTLLIKDIKKKIWAWEALSKRVKNDSLFLLFFASVFCIYNLFNFYIISPYILTFVPQQCLPYDWSIFQAMLNVRKAAVQYSSLDTFMLFSLNLNHAIDICISYHNVIQQFSVEFSIWYYLSYNNRAFKVQRTLLCFLQVSKTIEMIKTLMMCHISFDLKAS